MTYCRLIAPKWLEETGAKKVIEGLFSDDEIKAHNESGYNVYFLPNAPSEYHGGSVSGDQVDQFNFVFVDMDLKGQKYESKEAFIQAVGECGIEPTTVIDSGGGIHVYWQVSDLDAISYLRLSRRLMRLLNTDDAVGQIFQLMRLPGTLNTKIQGDYRPCEVLFSSEACYTCEELDKLLPPITVGDEAYCQQHFDRTYNLDRKNVQITDKMPDKFGKLLRSSKEAKELWSGNVDDRSKADYRLAHIMYAQGFTKEEAIIVLANSAKALQRAPVHRLSYGENIVDKIWVFEEAEDKAKVSLSPSVRELLSKGEETVKGTRFPCHRWIDDTEHGYRLGQVMGIVGGSGVGKTTLTLNAFLWFAEHNPDYHHFFMSLEQPPGEIANRIRTICGDNTELFDKIHIVSNYEEDGTYKNLSLKGVEDHLLAWQQQTGAKVGAVVIDHIGVLAKNTKNGEGDGLIGICNQMKAVAVRLNAFLIMLSQAPREKAGIGDLELNKDAAYGTVAFESYCDYLLCLWQPLKRVYAQGSPTVMAIKFAKIRHKKQGTDRIQEDICYQFFFDPKTERLRELTQDEEKSAAYFLNQATNMRKRDRKTDLVQYNSRRLESSATEVKAQPTHTKH